MTSQSSKERPLFPGPTVAVQEYILKVREVGGPLNAEVTIPAAKGTVRLAGWPRMETGFQEVDGVQQRVG